MSGWSQEAFELADIADELAAVRYYIAALAGAKLQPPTPYPRPSDKPVSDEPLTAADLNSFFGGV